MAAIVSALTCTFPSIHAAVYSCLGTIISGKARPGEGDLTEPVRPSRPTSSRLIAGGHQRIRVPGFSGLADGLHHGRRYPEKRQR